MIAFRLWRVDWEGRSQGGRPVLKSLFIDEGWPGPHHASTERPSARNVDGVHAWAPWSRPHRLTMAPLVLAEGAIDLFGRVVVHEDGVVRGERARILALRVRPPLQADGHAFVGTSGALMYCTCRLRHVQAPLPLDHVERLLLDRYGVPRLPDGVAPWE